MHNMKMSEHRGKRFTARVIPSKEEEKRHVITIEMREKHHNTGMTKTGENYKDTREKHRNTEQ